MRFYEGRISTPHPTHNLECHSILVQALAQNLSETTGPTSIWVAVSVASENWNIMGTSLQENNAALLLQNNAPTHKCCPVFISLLHLQLYRRSEEVQYAWKNYEIIHEEQKQLLGQFRRLRRYESVNIQTWDFTYANYYIMLLQQISSLLQCYVSIWIFRSTKNVWLPSDRCSKIKLREPLMLLWKSP